jgi:hypothetical protein
MKDMKELLNVTLIAITSVRVDRTISALKYSLKNINFNSVKLLTDKDVIDDVIEIIKISELDYENYSKFIVYDLHKYINTSHVLIIQDDGFVVNADKWDNSFLNYDYIGAPWPLPHDDFSYRDINNNIVRVGNGGFSLRSKKLLSMSEELDLEWKSYYGYYNEDGFFTCHNRHIFESNGCIFAPLDVAKYFSHESNIPEIQGITPFGFHGKNKHYNNLI